MRETVEVCIAGSLLNDDGRVMESKKVAKFLMLK